MAMNAPRIMVWDWAVRLVHWLMVILVPLLWWTAEEGHMDWHKSLGLTMLGIVLFRLIWGLIGTTTARFVPMVERIKSLQSYVGHLRSGRYIASFGHSPLAVFGVFALLLALTTQIGTGLFSVDVDGLESGPLAVLVSFDVGRQLAEVHEFNFNLLAALIGLHLTAIAIYHFALNANLVGPMVHGHRPSSDFPDRKLPDIRIRLFRLVAAIVLSLACVIAISEFG